MTVRIRMDDNPVIPGTLYLVATPIGNLEDCSPRAARILAEVDQIAAEDTRRTAILLQHLGIRKPLISYHRHSKPERQADLLAWLLSGASVALVSDAGMPTISDPGAELVAACIERDVVVCVIPGPSASLTALAGSGMPADRFVFEGFLPLASRTRRERLGAIAAETRTIVLYEAPHRLLKTLGDLVEAGCGSRRICLARELTKRFEEFRHGTVDGLIADLASQEPRGEYVLVLEGCAERSAGKADEPDPASIERRMTALLDMGYGARDAARQAASEGWIGRREGYALAARLLAQRR